MPKPVPAGTGRLRIAVAAVLIAAASAGGAALGVGAEPAADADRAMPWRWQVPVVVKIAEGLGLTDRLRPAVTALTLSTGLKIQLIAPIKRVERRPKPPRPNLFVDALGYAVIGDAHITFDPYLEPVRVSVEKRRFRWKTDRGYCYGRPFDHEYGLRCTAVSFLMKRYLERYRDVFPDRPRFWREVVPFTPGGSAHVDGFFNAGPDGAIYFAQCFVPLREAPAVRGYLAVECLIRALGLPHVIPISESSALATQIVPVPLDGLDRSAHPGLYAVRDGPWRGGPGEPPMPTAHDLRLLAARYFAADR